MFYRSKKSISFFFKLYRFNWIINCICKFLIIMSRIVLKNYNFVLLGIFSLWSFGRKIWLKGNNYCIWLVRLVYFNIWDIKLLCRKDWFIYSKKILGSLCISNKLKEICYLYRSKEIVVRFLYWYKFKK